MSGPFLYTTRIVWLTLYLLGLVNSIRGQAQIRTQQLLSYHRQAVDSLQVQPRRSLEAALKLKADGAQHPVWQMLGSIHTGNYYKRIGLSDSALYHYEAALQRNALARNDSLLAEVFYQKGVTWAMKGLHDSAAFYQLRGLKLYEQLRQSRGVVRSLYALGKLYDQVSDSGKAGNYYRQCMAEAKRSADTSNLALAYDGLAAWQVAHGRPDKALKAYAEALPLYTALHSVYDVARCQANMGSVYDELGQSVQSLLFYEAALKGFEQIGSRDNVVWTLVNLGATCFNSNDLKSALNHWQRAEKLCKELKLYPQWQATCEYLSAWYEQQGDYKKAYAYHQQFVQLRDSLQGIAKQNFVNALEQRYQNAKKENAIRTLQQENRLKAAESAYHKKRSLWYLISGLLVVCVSILLIWFYRHRVKTARLLAEQNEALYRKKINELIKEQELKSISEIMESQENERKRIAEDLHDRLGSMLATVKLHFNALEQKVDAMELKQMDQYQKANAMLDSVCDEVRKIAHNMESGVLVNFGLLPALEDLKEVLEETGDLRFSLNSFGMKQRLGSDIEIVVYRVVQELISNTIKHAGATEIGIEINRSADRLVVMVSDNGKGYNTEQSGKGMGLSNIRSRVARLNGTFYVDSNQKNGTTNIIEIPLKHDSYFDS